MDGAGQQTGLSGNRVAGLGCLGDESQEGIYCVNALGFFAPNSLEGLFDLQLQLNTPTFFFQGIP